MSSDQGLDLFNRNDDLDGDDGQENPFDESEERPVKKLKKNKKKHKKEKKQKKKKRREYEENDYDFEEEEEQNQLNSLFDQQAESDDEAEEQMSDSDEIGGREQDYFNHDLFNRKKTNQEFYENLYRKDEAQLNKEYNRKANKRQLTEEMYPGKSDPKLFVVNVRPNHQQEMVLCILNKARYLKNTEERVKIVSCLAMKKKYPGRIFVEAFYEKDIRQSLEGFNNVNLSKKIVELDADAYANLFSEKMESRAEFQVGDYVRIKKGLYDGDLGKILKSRKNSTFFDVLLVPRINLQDISMKIREQTSKMSNEEEIRQKKNQLFRLLTNHKTNYYKVRPNKSTVRPEQLEQFSDIAALKDLKIDRASGLFCLGFRYDEINRVQGSYLPVQILPFTSDGKFSLEDIQNDKKHFTTTVNFKKGEEVEIIAGQLAKHFGTIIEIRDNVGIIKCKNKGLFGEILEEPLEHLTKRFKEGEHVKVVSGADMGKTGVILKVEPRLVQIWTDNNNSIRINKNNLELHHGEVICEQNVHGLKKDDLIKTSKNVVGIVIETQKDNIKILDSNNTVQIISNMDFDSQINTRNLIAKNRTGEQITSNSSVRIRQGPNEGRRCVVKHVYRQFVFLFNQSFDRTAGISVESADNCSLISKNEETKKPFLKNAANLNTSSQVDDEIKVGKTITLKSGPLKGYQGIVKSINKDKIEVRVPSKSCTEWVQRENVAAKQQTLESGKTPNRKGGPSVSHIYAASPMKY